MVEALCSALLCPLRWLAALALVALAFQRQRHSLMHLRLAFYACPAAVAASLLLLLFISRLVRADTAISGGSLLGMPIGSCRLPAACRTVGGGMLGAAGCGAGRLLGKHDIQDRLPLLLCANDMLR